jgi:hypothetical protein
MRQELFPVDPSGAESASSQPHRELMRAELRLRACSDVLDRLGLALVDLLEVEAIVASNSSVRGVASARLAGKMPAEV